MEKLVRWTKVQTEHLAQIESPTFARRRVESALRHDEYLVGLDELIRSCTHSSPLRAATSCTETLLAHVEHGRWLLITPRPLRPFVSGGLGHYPHLSWCQSNPGCPSTSVLHEGPGKWRTVDISVDMGKSALAFAANLLVSRGEDRMFLSEGKDYSNTVRTITQRWTPLEEHELRMSLRSTKRNYGEIRHIRQVYVEADDHWPVDGKSWHWRPVVADTIYEQKGGVFWP